MPAEPRPWTLELKRLVANGVHHREDLIRLATPFVPIGHAWRTREWYRLHEIRRGRERRGGEEASRPSPKPEKSLAQIHQIGARKVIIKTLHQLQRDGRVVERDGLYYPANGTAAPPEPRRPEA